MRLLLMTLATLLLFPSVGQTAEMQLINRAFICDTLEQLTESLDNGRLGDVEGCGFLMKPAPALVEDLGTYDNDHGTFTLTRMTFPALGAQYGFSSFTAGQRL
jgi:hypothetical protein